MIKDAASRKPGELNIAILDPLVKFLFKKSLEKIPGGRIEEQQSECVRQKTGGQQNNSSDKNKQGIDEVLSRNNPLLQTGLNPIHGLHSLHPRQVGAGKSRYDNQKYGIQSTDGTAELNKEIDFKNGD